MTRLRDLVVELEANGAVARALERFAGKRVERPWRKRGVAPV